MNNTKILLIRFQNKIKGAELEAFRGAIVSELNDKNILFHNHLPNNSGYRYSYPLIQYKRINQKAAIFCIGPGTDTIGQFFFDSDLELRIGERTEKFEIENINAHRSRIQLWDYKFQYRIRKWLALNQDNYDIYSKLESVAEKSSFLEKILTGNILSFAKGLDIFFDKQVECKITRINDPKSTWYKGVKMNMFDAEFSTNISIPDYAGLGKGVSIGYGTTVRKREQNNNK